MNKLDRHDRPRTSSTDHGPTRVSGYLAVLVHYRSLPVNVPVDSVRVPCPAMSRLTRSARSGGVWTVAAEEQHEFLQQQLRRNLVSRRNMLKGSVGAVGATFLLGNGFGSPAFADQLTSTGTVAGGFVVNGRHLSFGADPQRQMWVAGQLFNLNTYNAVPSGMQVFVEYGLDPFYGAVAPAELRELVTHVPVWNGVPTGPITASTTDLLNATQFYVHALLDNLRAGSDLSLPLRLPGGVPGRFDPGRDADHGAGPAACPPAVHLHRLRRPGHYRRARNRVDP